MRACVHCLSIHSFNNCEQYSYLPVRGISIARNSLFVVLSCIMLCQIDALWMIVAIIPFLLPNSYEGAAYLSILGSGLIAAMESRKIIMMDSVVVGFIL